MPFAQQKGVTKIMIIATTKRELAKRIMLCDVVALAGLLCFFQIVNATTQQIFSWFFAAVALLYYSLVNLPRRAEDSESILRRMEKKLNETATVQAIGPCAWKNLDSAATVVGVLVMTEKGLYLYPLIGKELVGDTPVYALPSAEIHSVRHEKKSRLLLSLTDQSEVSFSVEKAATWANQIHNQFITHASCVSFSS